MNMFPRFFQRKTGRLSASTVAKVPAPTLARRYPAREPGVGYGRSSGYATSRHYADLRTPQLFRFC